MQKAIVCVTGANGYIGSHIVRELLSRGYHVRATLTDSNDLKRTEHLKTIAEASPNGELTFFTANLCSPNAFDDPFHQADYVIHCAASVNLDTPDDALLKINLEGTHNILSSLQKQSSVKKFIYTSSLAAVVHDRVGKEHVFSENDWYINGVELDPYAYAKAESEKAIFAAFQQASTETKIVTFQPGLALGPAYSPRAGITPRILQALYEYSLWGLKLSLPLVDVRDIAIAHARAIELEGVEGRFILSNENMSVHEMTSIIDAQYPERSMAARPELLDQYFLLYMLFLHDLQTRISQATGVVENPFVIDNSKARNALDLNYLPLQQSIVDTCENFIAQMSSSKN